MCVAPLQLRKNLRFYITTFCPSYVVNTPNVQNSLYTLDIDLVFFNIKIAKKCSGQDLFV